jgi:hypothetical protein
MTLRVRAEIGTHLVSHGHARAHGLGGLEHSAPGARLNAHRRVEGRAPTDTGAIVVRPVEMMRASPELHRGEASETATLQSPLRFSSVAVERLGDPLGLPPPPRLSGERLAVLAALAGVGAIALGGVAMATSLGSDAPPVATGAQTPAVATGSATRTKTSSSFPASAVALLAKPSTERIALTHSRGRIILAVGVRGRSVLVLDGLERAPSGRSYHAWLLGRKGAILARAAIFSGRERLVPLSRLVPPGAGVGVTLERAGGVATPTRKVVLAASRGGA